MKFICEGKQIRQEIEYALSCCYGKSSISLASAVLLDNRDDTLTIVAMNGKLSFRSETKVSTIETGAVCVYCDKLLAILKNMPEGNLEFIEQKGKVTVRPSDSGDRIQVNIKTLDATRYPESDAEAKDGYFAIPQKDFCDMVDKTALAVADDNGRAFLTGVYLDSDIDGNELVMVATDGRRLAYAHKVMEEELPVFKPGIVPVSFLSLVKNMCSEEGMMSIAINEGTIYAKVGDHSVSAPLIGGAYPNYRRVIPKSLQYSCQVKTDTLTRAMSLISVLIEAKSRMLFMDFSNEGLTVSGENAEFGDSKQRLAVNYDGPSVNLAFNCSLLLPCLKKIDTDSTTIDLNGPGSAIVVRPVGSEWYLYVIMPMQG